MIRSYLALAMALCGLLWQAPSFASDLDVLREDCLAAEALHDRSRSPDPLLAIRAARCNSYVAGFTDGYVISEYLAGQVGLKLNAICLPEGDDARYRLVRAVLAHLEHFPPGAPGTPATLVAGALSKSFPCP